MISIIVTADNNWGIGKAGKTIVSIPEDARYIRSTTNGQTVIVGRRTFENILKRREPINHNTVILSTETRYVGDNVVVAHTPEEAVKQALSFGTDVYVIGGDETYKALLPYCDEVQVTKIDYVYDVDAYFPNLDKMPEWVIVDKSEEQTQFDLVYYYYKYKRRKDYRA